MNLKILYTFQQNRYENYNSFNITIFNLYNYIKLYLCINKLSYNIIHIFFNKIFIIINFLYILVLMNINKI